MCDFSPSSSYILCSTASSYSLCWFYCCNLLSSHSKGRTAETEIWCECQSCISYNMSEKCTQRLRIFHWWWHVFHSSSPDSILIRICNVGSSCMRLSWRASTLNQLRRSSLSCWPLRTYVIKHSDSELVHKTWALLQPGWQWITKVRLEQAHNWLRQSEANADMTIINITHTANIVAKVIVI